jgi:hypothetical protein
MWNRRRLTLLKKFFRPFREVVRFMSQVQQLKGQLYQIATEATQGAASLGGYKQRFSQSSAQVLALIQGSATRADSDISQLLDAAGKAVEQASEALQIAAQGCKNYADQI